MIEEPIVWNHWLLKSGMVPLVRPNENLYSLQLVLIRSNRKAVLKNVASQVTVVVRSRRRVSVLYPIQSTSMMQNTLRM